jgi:Uma2 family endonuclease
MVTKPLLTAEDLLQMPEDGYRYELAKGVLIKMTPAGAKHGTIAGRLFKLLAGFVDDRGMGVVCAAETGFKLELAPDTVRAPDISFVSKERLPAGGPPDGYWPFAPDLAVEVVSPADTAGEVMAKVIAYLEAGTRLVWVVYPKTETVVVHRPAGEARVLRGEDTLDGGELLPGFTCKVREIFAL